ncbi:hypothetical protein OQA88_12540 [Cercophora sp. LCS_1]
MDPLSASSSVLTLVVFAFQSSVALYTTVRSFRSQDKDVRALRDELGDLSKVLESLQQTAGAYATVDLDDLKLPLHRCGKACEEYGDIITKCTKHSDGSRPSLRDWVTQKYLQGDINQFREMLAGYKSTINVAIAHANLRVAAITPTVLEDYKEMVRDTSNDLKGHMERLEATIEILAAKKTLTATKDDAEWQAMLEEKACTQQGLKICAQLSIQIGNVISAHQQRPRAPQHPQMPQRHLAHQYIRDGMRSTNDSIRALAHKLQEYEAQIEEQIDAMDSTAESPDEQLTRLKETKESIHQCLKVVSDANDTADIERRNVFEDITMADEAYDFSISTFGDLITARRIHLTGRSRHIGGQLTSADYQATIEAVKMVDLNYQRGARDIEENGDPDSSASTTVGREGTSEFNSRYGPLTALLLLLLLLTASGAARPILTPRKTAVCYAGETLSLHCYNGDNGANDNPPGLVATHIQYVATYLRKYGRENPRKPYGRVQALIKHINVTAYTSVLYADIATPIERGLGRGCGGSGAQSD